MFILDTNCRWPGSAHDATIFLHSTIYERFTNNEFGHSTLVGDSAYAPDNFLCKALQNTVSNSEKNYQFSHIRTRNVAERVYGVLKRKFPCLHFGMSYKRHKVQDVIFACCILYNFIRKHSPEDFEDDITAEDRNVARPIQREEIERQNEFADHYEMAIQAQAMSI